jgi:hypothetical protein
VKNRPAFCASVIISIALALFSRFGASAYMRLFVFVFEREEAMWITGGGFFTVAKAIQSAPLCYRLGVVRGIRYEWLAFAALFTTAIDIIVTFKAYPWAVKGEIEILNVMLSIGIIGWAGLIRFMVLQWLPIRSLPKHQPMLTAIPAPQYIDLPIPLPAAIKTSQSSTDREFVAQLIPKVASLFIAGLSGSGKDFVGSLLCEYLQSEFGAKTFFLDPKNDPNENMWNNADYQYRFAGTMMEPEEFLEHLKRGFKQYGEKLQENGSRQYTILILNELATCATKVDNSSDKKWLAANLQPMLSGLDSVGGCVIVLTQTLLVPNGFNSGTVAQFQKLIICRNEHIENLRTQSKAVLLNGVDIDGAKEMCRDSPIDRAIYSSSLRRWLALPKLRQGQSYYDRDNRRWVGGHPSHDPKNSQNTVAQRENAGFDAVPTHDPTASDARSDALIDALWAYFESVDEEPKPLGKIRGSRRMTNLRASTVEIHSMLDRLTAEGVLVQSVDGWTMPLQSDAT